MSKEDDYSKFEEELKKELRGDQAQISSVLDSPQIKGVYGALKDGRVPERVVKTVMLDGLKDLAETGSISPHKYTAIIARELAQLGNAEEALDYLHKRKHITDKEYERYTGIAKKATEEQVEGMKRGLEKIVHLHHADRLKKAVVILLLVGGVYYIFKSIPSITGGVIGSSASGNIIFGSVLFLFALAISHFYIKE